MLSVLAEYDEMVVVSSVGLVLGVLVMYDEMVVVSVV